MQPGIISKGELLIRGVTGDGAQTGQLWEEFDRAYAAAGFDRADDYGYEVRLNHDCGCDCHVGFAARRDAGGVGFATLTLPESEYAVFDVYVAKGYDSENAAMRAWLDQNPQGYVQSALNGRHYVVECYNERFKGGGQPDSIVEIWIPVHRP